MKQKQHTGGLNLSRMGNLPVVVPAVVLVVGLTTASLIYQTLEQRRNEFNQASLDRAVTAMENEVRQRLVFYQTALVGASSFLSVEGRVDPNKWLDYVDRLAIPVTFSGTNGLAVIVPVKASERAQV